MKRSMRGRLHHLVLESSKPEALARFYATALDMAAERRGDAWVCQAPNRHLMFVEGKAGTLHSAGYAVSDRDVLEELKKRISSNNVEFDVTPTALFPDYAISFRDPDGNQIAYGISDDASVSSKRLPARLQHLVVGSTNAATMVDFYTNVVGLRESDRVNDDDRRLRTSFMRTDNEHHSFAVFQTSECRLDHHCYELEDWNSIRDWGDRFASLRTPVKWGPGRHGPGNNLFMFIHDPDGNWVELSAELQIVADDKPVGEWRHEEHTLNSWGQAFLRT